MNQWRFATWRLVLVLVIGLTLGTVACASQPQTGPAQTGGQDVATEGQAAAATDAVPATMAGDPEAGQEAYAKTCGACHGPDARGLAGLGKDLHSNEFLAGLNDEEAVAFLKVGRPAGDPLNTTGVDMPPKGGNPALNDDDLLNIVAYVRTLE